VVFGVVFSKKLSQIGKNHPRTFRLMGIRMHIGLGGLTEENLMVILDSHRGAVRDAVLLTKAMVGESNLNRVFPDENNLSLHNDDLIRLE
jgi:hypothetical protein